MTDAFRHETERLVLRDWTEEDRQRFYDVMNVPPVMKYLGGVKPFEHWSAAYDRLQGYARDFGHCFWLVERKADGDLLGFCGLKRVNYTGAPNQGMPEIGWRFRESAWGQGFAKEGAIASLDLAFDRFGYDEVTALTVTANAPSWGLMERLGMIERPELAYDDEVLSEEFGPVRQWIMTAERWPAERARLTA